MDKQFRQHLISEGYSEMTPSGNKSTVYDYSMRVSCIMEWEGLSWEELVRDISTIEQKYDIGGEKEDIGKKSHSAYINALRAFRRFCKTL